MADAEVVDRPLDQRHGNRQNFSSDTATRGPITVALDNPSFGLSVVIAYTSVDGLAESVMTDMNQLPRNKV